MTMADNLIDFLNEAEEVFYEQSDPSEMSDYPQTLVTEKIIFLVDILLLENEAEVSNSCSVSTLLKSYYNLKKKICVKPPEFECLVYNKYTIIHSCINNEKDIKYALHKIRTAKCEEEEEPLEIDKIFDEIASLVELPHPESTKKSLPPNWVYHVVWFFGRNLHMPTMENTNSYDFLMMTPYFALDILYLHDNRLQSNQCEEISQALLGLNENGKGYFLSTSAKGRQRGAAVGCLAQFLGHPLIRVPQSRARFSIHNLGFELNIMKNNNDDEGL